MGLPRDDTGKGIRGIPSPEWERGRGEGLRFQGTHDVTAPRLSRLGQALIPALLPHGRRVPPAQPSNAQQARPKSGARPCP